MKNEGDSNKRLNTFLMFVVAASFFLFFFSNPSLTGYATSGSTTSNVSIAKYLSIAFGANLSQGIYFGTVNTLPATNINATHNNDSAAYAGGTTYTIDVSTDSNAPVDFCIKANTGLTDPSLDVIGLANETFAAYNLTSASLPPLSNETSMTTTYQKSVGNIAIGNSSYWRFWLDIPSAQPSGDYNNSVSFEGVVNGLAC
jgi:hypothetical protein